MPFLLLLFAEFYCGGLTLPGLLDGGGVLPGGVLGDVLFGDELSGGVLLGEVLLGGIVLGELPGPPCWRSRIRSSCAWII